MIISLGGYSHFLVVSFQCKSSDLALNRHFAITAASRVLHGQFGYCKEKYCSPGMRHNRLYISEQLQLKCPRPRIFQPPKQYNNIPKIQSQECTYELTSFIKIFLKSHIPQFSSLDIWHHWDQPKNDCLVQPEKPRTNHESIKNQDISSSFFLSVLFIYF